MAGPLATVDWGQRLLRAPPDPAAEAEVKRAVGTVPRWLRPYLPCPWLVKAMVRLALENRTLVHLDFETVDLVALVVSQENSCRYCYAITRAQLRVFGLSEERMQALEQALVDGTLPPQPAAAVHFARRLARANPLAGAAGRAALRAAGFSEPLQREIAYAAAMVAFYNRVNTLAGMSPMAWERLPEHWALRLLRPLAAFILRRMRKRGTAVTSAPPSGGPFAALLAVYADSPVGAALGQSLAEAWASPLLPRRAKALMLAVIAQGLGASGAAAEARSLLAAEGLADEAAGRLLAHLDSSALDATEAALIPFARDTLWYEPAQVQRRGAALQAQLGTPAFVEALGFASLANSLCRLDAALVER